MWEDTAERCVVKLSFTMLAVALSLVAPLASRLLDRKPITAVDREARRHRSASRRPPSCFGLKERQLSTPSIAALPIYLLDFASSSSVSDVGLHCRRLATSRYYKTINTVGQRAMSADYRFCQCVCICIYFENSKWINEFWILDEFEF